VPINRGTRWSAPIGQNPSGAINFGRMSMITRVKICGLQTEAALEAALHNGADFVGFVFFPPSPRHIALAQARALARKARGQAKIVALMVDPDDALIDAVTTAVTPDLIQLHGEETPNRVADIHRRSARPLMKAIKVRDREDLRSALGYRNIADLILFDAPPPAGATRPGGHGETFDWQALAGLHRDICYMLSGGLTPENVAEAIQITGAPIVDVSSGVERSLGEKDPDLIRRFLQAAKGAKQDGFLLAEP
jgi:phosphoribosylanthranilate isomerase